MQTTTTSREETAAGSGVDVPAPLTAAAIWGRLAGLFAVVTVLMVAFAEPAVRALGVPAGATAAVLAAGAAAWSAYRDNT